MGPRFETVYESGPVGEMRQHYQAIRHDFPELPELTGTFSKDEASKCLDEWEAKSSNQPRLSMHPDTPADELFKPGGVFSRLVQFVLFKASVDLASEIDSSGKDSALTALTRSLVASRGAAARADWELKHAAALTELKSVTEDAVESATKKHEQAVNAALAQYLSRTQVRFKANPTDWAIKGDPSISTKVEVDGGEASDVISHGHGMQRAIMMAMVQSLAEVGFGSEGTKPLLVLAYEEPEIYQHPVRARSFARSLTKLANGGDAQVVMATHSPYFVLPEHFNSLWRISLDDLATQVRSATVEELGKRLSKCPDEVMKTLHKELPRRLSEGFFSDCVVLVEGDTDRIVLEVTAELMEMPFDEANISMISCDGKENLPAAYHMFQCLGIATFVVMDGDFLAAGRKHEVNTAKWKSARDSHQSSTKRKIQALAPAITKAEENSFQFGHPTTVGTSLALLHDCIEHELTSWPSFSSNLEQIGGKLFNKDIYGLRTAARGADVHDLPDSLRKIVKTFRNRT